MLVNQLVTSDVFFHWLSFVAFLIVELMLSRICLLTLPSSLFAGFMRRHMGWLAKLSLWSFRVIKACCFAICSVRSSMLSYIYIYIYHLYIYIYIYIYRCMLLFS